nr:probable LRR receptor-like serine/threonine-protein kinase At4g37250 [Ipomoea trifida]
MARLSTTRTIPPNATLDLSFNNLSGEIPDSSVFLNQDVKAFAGNPKLCGVPLENLCHDSRVVGTNFAAGHRRHSQNNPLKSRGGLAGFRFLPCVVTHPSQNQLDYRNCRRRRRRSRNSRPDFHLRLSRQATESHRRNHKEISGKRKKLRLGIILRIPHGIQLAKVMDVFEDTETRRRLRRRIGNHRL